VRSCGVSGRSKNRWALRQACEWAAPMKPYPIMPTFRAPVRACVVVIGGALLLEESFGLGGRGSRCDVRPPGRGAGHAPQTSRPAGERAGSAFHAGARSRATHTTA